MLFAALVYDRFNDPFAKEQCQASDFTIQQKWGTRCSEDEAGWLRSNNIHTCGDALSVLGTFNIRNILSRHNVRY